MTNKLFVVSYYEGNAVYEPAEGGSYVGESLLRESTVKMKWKHAKREFKRMVREMSEYLGVKPCFVNARHAYFEYGKHIGETVDLWIEAEAGQHEERYEGYC